MEMQTIMTHDREIEMVSSDVIPLLEIDAVIADARKLCEARGSLPYMSDAWWERPNRHNLISHLERLYNYCVKQDIPYMEATRFINRVVYHVPATRRLVVREISQSIGSTTFRAHFRDLHNRMHATSGYWSDLFPLEDRFWEIQSKTRGRLDTAGASVKVGGKTAYILWEALDTVRRIAKTRGVEAIDFLDYVMSKTRLLSPQSFATSIGANIPPDSSAIRAFRAKTRLDRIFGSAGTVKKVDSHFWLEQIGLASIKQLKVPLGFYISSEHLSQGGTMADVVEISGDGRYRTKDGSVRQGDYWFIKAKNPWLVVQVDHTLAQNLNLDSWYDPSKYDKIPTVAELKTLDPTGPWTKVWDPSTGRPISSQAGKTILKLK
jgi:hypothetical protein